MENKYTVEYIIKYTGLKPEYLRKVIRELKPFLEPYITRGDKNSLLFDSNGLIIFDRIKQYKESGLSLPTIADKLGDIEIKSEDKQKQTRINRNDSYFFESALNEVKKAQELVLLSKEQTIQTQKDHISVLEKQVLLLTDGRSPEEVKAEFITKEVSLKTKEIELENLKTKSEEFKENLSQEKAKLEEKNKELSQKEKEVLEQKNRLTRLEDEKKQLQKTKDDELQRLEREKNSKLQEQEKIIREKEEKAKALEKEKQELEERENEKEKKRQDIIKELDTLEGKWFVGNKRKELLKQLQDL